MLTHHNTIQYDTISTYPAPAAARQHRTRNQAEAARCRIRHQRQLWQWQQTQDDHPALAPLDRPFPRQVPLRPPLIPVRQTISRIQHHAFTLNSTDTQDRVDGLVKRLHQQPADTPVFARFSSWYSSDGQAIRSSTHSVPREAAPSVG
jgi:hypothetical protein